MEFTALTKHLHLIGIHPRTGIRNLKAAPRFLRSLRQFRELNTRPTFQPHWTEVCPILWDFNDEAGVAAGDYFHQDLWAARKIFQRRPDSHIDIGSRIDGFISHLLVFMPVTVVDLRHLTSEVHGLNFVQDDATKLKQLGDASVRSLSSLHVAEHFGLGRYSDDIDPDACFTFMAALERVLAPEGILYFSVPIGRERVEFNAHRVFSTKTILQQFASLKLLSFSLVGSDGQFYEGRDPEAASGLEYACGLFEFTKPA